LPKATFVDDRSTNTTESWERIGQLSTLVSQRKDTYIPVVAEILQTHNQQLHQLTCGFAVDPQHSNPQSQSGCGSEPGMT
jgi:hypothetical protein